MSTVEQAGKITFTIKLLVFVIIGILVLILLNLGVDSQNFKQSRLSFNSTYQQFGEMTSHEVRAKIVILGASQAKHGINPKYLENENLRVFNFAQTAASARYVRKFYKHLFLKNYLKPDLIIYEVNPYMFQNFLGRKFEDDIQYYPWNLYFKNLINPTYPIDIQDMLKKKFIANQGKDRLLGLICAKTKGSVKSEKYYNGYVPLIDNQWDFDGSQENHNPRVHVQEQVEAFKETLNMIQKDNINIILVHTPEFIPARIANQKSYELLQEIATKRSIPFLNYNDFESITSVNFDTKNFYDWSHLNEEAGILFSKRLREDMMFFNYI